MDPTSYFLDNPNLLVGMVIVIVTLTGSVGFLFRSLLKSKDDRLSDEQERSREVIEALNRNTIALDNLRVAISSLRAASNGGNNVG
jgi:hypothetical protein